MKGKQKSETVKVAVRVRPMNKHEIEQNSVMCVEVDTTNNQISVVDPKKDTKTFQFDYVYPMDSTQQQVYDQVAFPIVDSIFQGYNGTVFAYGQTGCGKTFTMMGKVDDPKLRGVIPNAFEHIFGYINAESSNKKFLVRCSFVEIYNEEVRDLLGNNPNKALDVREDPKKGTFVRDLSYTPLKNTSEIVKCLNKGNANRHVGATSMNDQSSRSHSLFTVYVEIEEAIDEKNKKIRTGKLNLVDLAGSERVGKTNATGQTFDEGKKINLSLTALGSVIDALSSNRKHIPYKDSKLTRLLADSLGGNTKTVMFANVSPASFNYDETVGTLRYASRAKLIKNAPKINEDPKDALLRKYEEEIKMLREQLEGKGGFQMSQQISPEPKGKPDDDENEKQPAPPQQSSAQMDPDEKRQLLEKIAQLEKEMIEGGTKGNKEPESGSDENLKASKVKEQEEKEEFRKYRLQQLKNVDEMEKKIEKLQEEKRKEEENLTNDVNKLRNRIKYLKGEIEDLKYDNEKDRTDFMENIKGINKDNALYRGIMKFLLSDIELKKIIDMSRYDEDNEKWFIHPFCFREKKLELPNVKPGQVSTFIENELNNRHLAMQESDKSLKKDRPKIVIKEAKKTLNKFRVSEDVANINMNRTSSKSIKNNDQKRPVNITKRAIPFDSVKSAPEEVYKGNEIAASQVVNPNTKNINMFLLKEREKEKLEELANYGRMNNQNSFRAGQSYNSLAPLKKPGRVTLDPIRGNGRNQFEVSFKATLEFRDKGFSMPANIAPRKIRLGQIEENNSGDEEFF